MTTPFLTGTNEEFGKKHEKPRIITTVVLSHSRTKIALIELIEQKARLIYPQRTKRRYFESYIARGDLEGQDC